MTYTDGAVAVPASRSLLADQPYEQFTVNEQTFTVLGTAHVSRASAETVSALIATGEYDAVAIELDRGRFDNLTDNDAWAKMDLMQVIKSGKAGLLAVNLALSSYQQRIAEQFGIEPGAEMRAAIAGAETQKVPLLLIDREIGITLNRVIRNVGFWKRMGIVSGLIASVFSNEKITEEDIEELKSGDILESTFAEFAEQSSEIYEPLVAERDEYLALELLRRTRAQAPNAKNILVVIGAGHLAGMMGHLHESHDAAPGTTARRLHELKQVPPPAKITKYIPWIIAGIIVLGFLIGFLRGGADFGLGLVWTWVLYNVVLTAIGGIIALAHPAAIAAAALSSPFSSLNPLISAGVVGAGTELVFRKPTVADFEALRTDVTTVKGWWKNKVARVLLVFILTTLGSASATYIAGFSIFGKIFGS